MANQPIDLVGQRFDKLTVLLLMEKTPSGSKWLCRCDCGNELPKYTGQLRRKGLAHTGCRSCERDSRSASAVEHGGCKDGKSKLYMIWKGMRSRCRDQGNTSWKYYGAKGITIDSVWDDFEAFRTWAIGAGYVQGMSVDRVNPDSGYSPSNCEIVTRSENSRRAIAHKKSRAA